MPTPPIAIIGAGPTGLTLARLLERQGIDYVVYEADAADAPNRAGGSLDIHPGTGQAALRACGLFDEFRAHARYEDQGFRIYGPDGVRRTELDEMMGRAGEDDRPEIDRAALRGILLDSVPGDKIRWAAKVEGLTMEEGGPVVRLADGGVERGFRLVVGADGAWSKVRPLVCQEKPIYSGLVFLEGRIETTSPSHPWACDAVGHGSAVVLGPSRTIAIQRQGNGSYRVYLELEADEAFARGVVSSHDDEALRSLMLSDEHFGAWAPEYKTMIGHLGFGGWRTWPLYYLPPASVSWKTVPGVALAGDAAHLAMPNGEGVNCGMEDALRLAEGISRHGMDGLEDAVREYEGEMMPRGREHIEDGIRLNGAMLHRDNPGVFIDLFRGMMQGQ